MLKLTFGSMLIAQEAFPPARGPHWAVDVLVPAIAIVSVFTMIVLVVAIPVITTHRYKRRVAELNANVKQTMIERGYSVDEILAVIHEDASLLHQSNGKSLQMTPSSVPLDRPAKHGM